MRYATRRGTSEGARGQQPADGPTLDTDLVGDQRERHLSACGGDPELDHASVRTIDGGSR